MMTLGGSQIEHELIGGTASSDIVHFELVSFTESASLWSHDLRSGATTLLRAPAVSLDPGAFITERVGVTSADGTVLPMFVTRQRDLPRSGDVPVPLYAYGGIGVSITPSFTVPWAVWLERGGMLAVAGLRGGGEYGRAWHEAGRRANKQNVFDDFCACARWLADSGWSRADRITINGGSNGGPVAAPVLAPAQRAARPVSADTAHDRRSRRPGHARSFIQVRRRSPGRAARRRADPPAGGHLGRARRREAHHQGHR
jgi:prolyl oligopeptidase PreP (S9A serine peptidase family)